jgi:hypothetical protein
LALSGRAVSVLGQVVYNLRMGIELEKHSFHSLDPIREEISGFESPIDIKSLEQQCDTPELKEALEDLLDQCLRYTETILRIRRMVQDGIEVEKDTGMSMDELGGIRSQTHNATIDTINSFSRALQKAGKDNAWMTEVTKGRASYGKFAVLITMARVLEEAN